MLTTVAISSAITLVNEPCYSFSSVDNLRHYAKEFLLEAGVRPSSAHGVVIEGVPAVVVGAGGGCSGVHANSGLVRGECLYLAVGDHLACIDLRGYELLWATKVDEATCFGVYYSEHKGALICHGELAISRIAESGGIVWSAYGADIFSEAFALGEEGIEATDFNGREYKFSYANGNAI